MHVGGCRRPATLCCPTASPLGSLPHLPTLKDMKPHAHWPLSLSVCLCHTGHLPAKASARPLCTHHCLPTCSLLSHAAAAPYSLEEGLYAAPGALNPLPWDRQQQYQAQQACPAFHRFALLSSARQGHPSLLHTSMCSQACLSRPLSTLPAVSGDSQEGLPADCWQLLRQG
jgi:hypothetical protein